MSSDFIATNAEVVVICITFNQEKYIADAIEGILGQITTFRYEIIVHDDCSTDATYSIAKRYAENSNGKIHLIRPNINQFSQGIPIIKKVISMVPDNCFIALCEGDDYWTDKYKLQRQYEYMKRHDNLSACFHQAILKDSHTEKYIGFHTPFRLHRRLNAESVIDLDGGFFATASIFFRKYCANKYIGWPQFGVEDYPLMIALSLDGEIGYLSKPMAVYRVSSRGSWSSRTHLNLEKEKEFLSNYRKMLLEIDDQTDGTYSNVIHNRIRKTQLNYYRKWEALGWINNQGLAKGSLKQRLVFLLRKRKLLNYIKVIHNNILNIIISIAYSPISPLYLTRIKQVMGLFGQSMCKRR